MHGVDAVPIGLPRLGSGVGEGHDVLAFRTDVVGEVGATGTAASLNRVEDLALRVVRPDENHVLMFDGRPAQVARCIPGGWPG